MIGKKDPKKLYFSMYLYPNDIPPVSANWKVSDDLLPAVTELMFYDHSSLKKEGHCGQHQKLSV